MILTRITRSLLAICLLVLSLLEKTASTSTLPRRTTLPTYRTTTTTRKTTSVPPPGPLQIAVRATTTTKRPTTSLRPITTTTSKRVSTTTTTTTAKMSTTVLASPLIPKQALTTTTTSQITTAKTMFAIAPATTTAAPRSTTTSRATTTSLTTTANSMFTIVPATTTAAPRSTTTSGATTTTTTSSSSSSSSSRATATPQFSVQPGEVPRLPLNVATTTTTTTQTSIRTTTKTTDIATTTTTTTAMTAQPNIAIAPKTTTTTTSTLVVNIVNTTTTRTLTTLSSSSSSAITTQSTSTSTTSRAATTTGPCVYGYTLVPVPLRVSFGIYNADASKRTGAYAMWPENINAKQFTHIIYNYANIDPYSYTLVPAPEDVLNSVTKELLYSRFNTHVKRNNINAKTLLGIGSKLPDLSSERFQLVSTLDPQRFAINAVDFAAVHGFSGLHVHWQWPATGTAPQFLNLLKSIRSAIAAKGNGMLLTVLLDPKRPGFVNATQVAEQVDFMMVPGYDIYAGGNVTRPHTSLLPYATWDRSEMSISQIVSNFLASGVPKSKFLLGLSTYGRAYSLEFPPDSPERLPNILKLAYQNIYPPGPVLGLPGVFAGFEISQYMGWEQCWVVTDMRTQTEVVQSLTTWITRDNPATITAKVKYLREQGLAGAYINSIDMDDYIFSGSPIIAAAAAELFKPTACIPVPLP